MADPVGMPELSIYGFLAWPHEPVRRITLEERMVDPGIVAIERVRGTLTLYEEWGERQLNILLILHLFPWHSDRYQDEIWVYGQGSVALEVMLTQAEELEGATEDDLHLPQPLRLAFQNLVDELGGEVSLGYHWTEPTRVLLELSSYEEGMDNPSLFLNALGERLNRWLPQPKTCL